MLRLSTKLLIIILQNEMRHMETIQNSDYVVNLIRSRFNFLFIRGFKIIEVAHQKHDVFRVVLEAECRILIAGDRDGEINLLISKCGTPVEGTGWFILEVLIYFLSNKEKYIGGYFGDLKQKDAQLLRLSKFLLDYLDKIIEFFTSGRFDICTFELSNLRETVDKLLYKEYLAKKQPAK